MKQKKKILIIGAAGMAGHMIYYYLKGLNKYDLFTTVFHTKLNEESIICDVRNKWQLEEVITKVNPDYIINAVGALIKESINHPENAILLNSWLPHILSKLAYRHQSKLIHISTDCVFSGKRGNYQVDDFRDADDLYGRSKALGELINDKDITIRTSIIGPEIKENGEGLLHWFLDQKGQVFGYSKVFWSGITTLELAKLIDFLINNFRPGIYQVAPNEKIDKYSLLKMFKDVFITQVIIIPDDSKSIDKSLLKSNNLIDYKIISYKDMILDLYSFIIRHSIIKPNE